MFEIYQRFEKNYMRIFCNTVYWSYLGMSLKTCWKKKTAHTRSRFRLLLLNFFNTAQREMRQVIQKIKIEKTLCNNDDRGFGVLFFLGKFMESNSLKKLYGVHIGKLTLDKVRKINLDRKRHDRFPKIYLLTHNWRRETCVGKEKANFVVLVPANILRYYCISEYFASMCLSLEQLSPVMTDLFHIWHPAPF